MYHFDISASPNLLMEPNISSDLPADKVDLTLNELLDIGWKVPATGTTWRRAGGMPAEASQRLSEAAAVISLQPVALQLRYLQTLTEIGMEKNTTIVFPLPIDILDYFTKARGKE